MQSLQKQAPYWKAPIGSSASSSWMPSTPASIWMPDHGLEVLETDRVVAVHVEALVLTIGALHPVRMARLLVDVADNALLDQVHDPLPVRVTDPSGRVVCSTSFHSLG